jgi:hypothetical protein
MLLETPLQPAMKKVKAIRSDTPQKTRIQRKVGEIASIYNLQSQMLA